MESITFAYLRDFGQLPPVAGSGGRILPVTGSQRRFCLDRQLDPQRGPDVVPLFYVFPAGTVDVARLNRAARWLSAWHPALRARLETIDGIPVQIVNPAPAALVTRLTPDSSPDARTLLRQALGAWPAEGPPLRLFLAADGATDILAVAFDHGMCDEQSINVVMGELSAAYLDGLSDAGVTAAETGARVAEYEDAVRRQLATEDAASDMSALTYWAGRLARVSSSAAAPRLTGEVGSLLHRVPRPASAQARPAAFPALLYACGGVARQLFGAASPPPLAYPWSSRAAESVQMAGCFMNTVVFPVEDDVRGAPEPLATVSDHWWDDLDWADTPFDEVLRAVRRGGGKWPGRFGGLITFEDTSRRPDLRLDGTTGQEIYLDAPRIRAPFCVSVSFREDLVIRMMWDSKLWEEEAGAEAFGQLVRTLTAALNAAPVT